ncbi:MAG: STAS domain-containing protein [Treponema sp.]|nr:STAS domain-containing protein [Treponema sp.]
MKDENLEVNQSIEGNICKFYAKGRVDSNTSDVLQFKLDKAIKEGHINIILNMAQIEYLSSIGIRVILSTYKQAASAGGSFYIESPSEIVRNVMGMVALKQMLLT